LASLVGAVGRYFHFAWRVGAVGVLWRFTTSPLVKSSDFSKERRIMKNIEKFSFAHPNFVWMLIELAILGIIYFIFREQVDNWLISPYWRLATSIPMDSNPNVNALLFLPFFIIVVYGVFVLPGSIASFIASWFESRIKYKNLVGEKQGWAYSLMIWETLIYAILCIGVLIVISFAYLYFVASGGVTGALVFLLFAGLLIWSSGVKRLVTWTRKVLHIEKKTS
jgi:hypothetical protein